MNRRAFVGACGATPLLASLFDRRRALAATAPPRRLVIFAHLEGSISKLWSPIVRSETDFDLSEPLAPLEPWKSRMLILDGLQSQSALDGQKKGVDPHAAAVSGMLTANADQLQRPAVPPRATASIDQLVGAQVRGPARLRSVELRVDAASVSALSINYPLAGGPPMSTPHGHEAIFDRLFGDVATADTPTGKRFAARRKSVVDYVAADLGSLAKVAGRENGRNVQAHLEAIRDIERRLAWRPAAACALPQRPKGISDKARVPEATKLNMDLLIQALACDVVRVATFGFCDTGFNIPAPWLDIPDPLHAISHGTKSTVSWSEAGRRVMRWTHEQMAYFLKALQAIPEGTGTMLDNTLVLSIAEFGDSSAHSCKNLPILLIGDAGGYFKTGRCLKLAGQPHNDVLTSIAHAVGVPTPTFGEPRYSKGPMPALRG